MSSASKNNPLHILVTGPPGVGKTTLVKKICAKLKSKGVLVSGFYTEEIRQGGQRVGFDVVTMEGKRGPLARLSSSYDSKQLGKMPKVGQYAVDTRSFEALALPTFQSQSSKITVLDEIGKMEMLSEHFKQEVTKVLKRQNTILATVPFPKGRPLPFIENLKKDPHVKVVVVNRENRDSLSGELTASLLAMNS